MIPFLIWRVLRSLVVIFIAALVLHTVLLIYLPDRLLIPGRVVFNSATGQYEEAKGFDRPPWPLGFFAWLFTPDDSAAPSNATDTGGDPNDPTRIITTPKPQGIDVWIGGWHIKGSGALTGDFGISTVTAQGLTVREAIGQRFGNTFWLVLAAFVPTLLIAIPLGVFAASRYRSLVDHTITLGSFLGFSMPPFWLGLVLILTFAVVAKSVHDMNHWAWLPYFPPGNAVGAADEDSWTSRLYHLVLPAATLAIAEIAVLSRQVRSAMLEVMHEDYVRTAWAKGLPPRRVLFRHAFRNALIPVITSIALTLPTLIAGTIVIENVFGYPGLGQLFFLAVGGSLKVVQIQFPHAIDYNTVMTLMLMMVAFSVLSSLVADILYMTLSPRLARR
jgi:peptide/nickel transport system permease protein